MVKHLLLLPVVYMALTFASHAAQIFNINDANWRWRPGTNEASVPASAWRSNTFNDLEFTTSPAPYWFGDPQTGGTEISGMSGVYSCIFLRKTFVVTNTAEIAALTLGAFVDDGFVAWINGTEVQRERMGAAGSPFVFTSLAVNAPEPPPFNFYDLTNPIPTLVLGTNVIAVQVFQSSLGSSDLGFDCSLDIIPAETVPPVVSAKSPAAGSTLGSLNEITVTFSEAVTGVSADDLLINAEPANSVTANSSSNYTFTFAQPAYGTVQIGWDPGHGIADRAIPPNNFDETGSGATWQYTLIDATPPIMASVTPSAGSTVRTLTRLTVVFSEPVQGVDAADLLINSAPATNVTEVNSSQYRFNFPEPPTGVVQVAWASGHGIQDLAASPNAFGGGSWTYRLDPNAGDLPPYISEFLTSNTRTGPPDEDGEFTDWIEIYNPGTHTVNLDRWCLTDTTNNYTKWRFPATNLPPNEFILVFASEKNRTNAGAPLHTNFRLSSSGEYLGLVMPDGITVVSEFYPTFPEQAPDVSYGFGDLTTNQMLIDSNSLVRVLVPNALTGTSWTTFGYDDNSWTLGTNGVGFGSTNVQADYGAAVLATEPVGYWRMNETSGTTAANTGSGAGLNATYNNVTLGNAGPQPPAFNGFESDNRAPTFNGTSSYVSPNQGLLHGRAAFTLAGWIRPNGVQADRTGLFGQNDCVEIGFITATTIQCWTTGPVDMPYNHAPGVWIHLAVVCNAGTIRIFTNGVQGASGSGSPTAVVSPFNIGGNGIFNPTGNFFNGQIDEVVLYYHALTDAQVRSLYSSGISGAGGSVVPYIRTHIGPAMSNINASAYIRIPFTVDEPDVVSLLTLRMRHDDGFAAYVNGNLVGSVNAPDPLNYNSAATNSHSPLSIDQINIPATVLQPGPNVLAIHGLNAALTNDDFLAAVELDATIVQVSTSEPLFFTVPTPGEQNNGGVALLGPAIRDPSHAPNVPNESEDVLLPA